MHALQKDHRRQSNNSRKVRKPKVRSILFVSPSSSGQLQIAKYFWSFYKPEGVEAGFAVLENNLINPWLKNSMKSFGHPIEQKQVESVFTLSTRKKDFDCIVSLGNFRNYSTISPFLNTLEILFGTFVKKLCWDIADPESIKGNNFQKSEQASSIRDRIEFEIAQFSQALEEHEDTAL